VPPTTTTATKVSTAPVMRDFRINTLTQLPAEATINEEDIIGKCTRRGLEGVILMFDWASHILMVRTSYKTPIFSSANDNLFDVFKAIIDDFSSSDEEERRDSYPEKGNCFKKKKK
jgi:hypothetical protein